MPSPVTPISESSLLLRLLLLSLILRTPLDFLAIPDLASVRTPLGWNRRTAIYVRLVSVLSTTSPTRLFLLLQAAPRFFFLRQFLHIATGTYFFLRLPSLLSRDFQILTVPSSPNDFPFICFRSYLAAVAAFLFFFSLLTKTPPPSFLL